ncbi:MAG: hypothetical protein PPP56_04935 [Longimonas sp.]|uniref:hypothetical protein n=1 Tax=Longimonas sp. TaxID=2039626 RepID=UPI00335C4949
MIRLSVRSTYGYGAIALLGAAVLPWTAANPAYWSLMVAGSMVVSASLVLLWRADAVSMPLVLGGALVLRLFYLPLEPVLSDDIYRYLWDARLLVEGGINPYAHPPEADVLRSWRDDWLYPALNSQAYHSIYPPFSQAVFAASYLIGGEGWTSYYMMKVMLVAAELSGVWALGRYVDARDLMLYAWHPLALLEVAGQGHTEALAVGGVGMALWAVWTQRKYLAAVAIALAGLAKLYPWVAFAWLFRRYGFRPVLVGGAVIAISFVPFWYSTLLADIGQSLRLYVQLFEFNAGPYYGVKEVLEILTGQDWSKVIGPVFGGLTLLALAAWIVRDWLKPVSFATFIAGALGR